MYQKLLLSALVVMMSASLTGYAAANETETSEEAYNQALAIAYDKPQQAEKVINKTDNPIQLTDYALFLYAFKEPSAQRDEKIYQLMADMKKAYDATPQERRDRINFMHHSHLSGYEGKKEDVPLEQVFLGMVRNAGSFWGYEIPCSFIRQKPSLNDLTGMYWGSYADNFTIQSGCNTGRGVNISGFPGGAVQRVEDAAAKCCDGNYYHSYSGSIRYGKAKNQSSQISRMKSIPQTLLEKPITSLPYQTWSYASLSNRYAWQEFMEVYQEAHDALVPYYTKNFRMSKADADKVIRTGFNRVLFGANCGGSPGLSVRKLILDDAPLTDIKALLNDFKKIRASAYRSCAAQAGLDPLIHVAIDNMPALEYVYNWAENTKPDPRDVSRYDLEMAVDTTNSFGKTPLMSAAQHDLKDAATFLLNKGADVNAQTKEVKGYNAGPKVFKRTPLMYAAASGSYEMVELLLKAGADKTLQDSEGHNAYDHLMGEGPVLRNIVMDDPSFEKAKQTLKLN